MARESNRSRRHVSLQNGPEQSRARARAHSRATARARALRLAQARLNCAFLALELDSRGVAARDKPNARHLHILIAILCLDIFADDARRGAQHGRGYRARATRTTPFAVVVVVVIARASRWATRTG